MSRDRPKRTRKIVNYGEDHLHWIEEAQLQKAFLRSLNEKDSPQKNSAKIRKRNTDKAATEQGYSDWSNKKEVSSDSNSDANLSQNAENTHIRSSKVVLEDIDKKLVHDNIDKDVHSSLLRKKNKNEQLSSTSVNSKSHANDSCELRLTRLQSKLLEEAGMLYPDSEVVPTAIHDKKSEQEIVLTPLKEVSSQSHSSPLKSSMSENDDGSLTPRVRAQRKFASNTSPPQTRSNSPVKMHRQKLVFSDFNGKQNMPSKEKSFVRGRAVRACSSEGEKTDTVLVNSLQQKKKCANGNNRSENRNAPSSVFGGVPKTDSFLSFLCFRNTTLKVELQDCMD